MKGGRIAVIGLMFGICVGEGAPMRGGFLAVGREGAGAAFVTKRDKKFKGENASEIQNFDSTSCII